MCILDQNLKNAHQNTPQIQIENELLEFIHLLDSRPQLWSVMGHSQLSI